MEKLHELFKSCFETEFAFAEANYSFIFSFDKEFKEKEKNYVFSVKVEEFETSMQTNFICYVESCEDSSGIGLAIYYQSDKTFFDFVKINF